MAGQSGAGVSSHPHEVLAFGEFLTSDSPGVRYVTLNAVAKFNTPASPFTVANERIAAGLAGLLGFPVPAGLLVHGEDPDMLGYASVHFGPGGERLPPVIPERVVAEQPKLAAATVAFDCWIANDDRHAANLAYAPDQRIPFAAFDHGHALLGAGSQGMARLKGRTNKAPVAGCLHAHLADGADLDRWADAIEGVTDWQIEPIVMGVVQAGALGELEAERVQEFLNHRKHQTMMLLERSDTLPRLKQWPAS